MSSKIPSPYLAAVYDAPVFIDEAQIEHLYDSLLRALYEFDGAQHLGTEAQEVIKVISDLNFSIIQEVDKYPQQKLHQILQIYDQTSSNKIVTFNNTPETDLFDSINTNGFLPQLIFMDLPGKNESEDGEDTILIPTAAEFENNHIEILAEQFSRNNTETGTWRLVGDETNVDYIIAVLEEQVQHEGDIKWVDFRLPVAGGDEKTEEIDFDSQASVHNDRSIHFHFTPKGEYDVSTFAYNLVKQGWKNGLKMIGMLNRGPDVHVISFYSK